MKITKINARKRESIAAGCWRPKQNHSSINYLFKCLFNNNVIIISESNLDVFLSLDCWLHSFVFFFHPIHSLPFSFNSSSSRLDPLCALRSDPLRLTFYWLHRHSDETQSALLIVVVRSGRFSLWLLFHIDSTCRFTSFSCVKWM